MNNEKETLWSYNFIILSLINFFLTLIFLLLNSTMTDYVINKFSSTTSQAGFVVGIFIIGSLIGRIIIGQVNYSKKLLYIGLIFFTLTTFLYFLNYGLIFLIISRLLNGLALGIVNTIIGTAIVRIVPHSRKGEGISYFAVSTALATGLGPFIGVYLSTNADFITIFKFCSLLGLISLIIGAFVNFPILHSSNATNNDNKFKLTNIIEVKALPISIIALCMTFCFSGVISYINVYSKELSLTEASSYFFIVYTIIVLITRPFTGRIVDKKGAKFILYPAFVVFSMGLFLLSFTSNSLMLLLSSALIALGFGNLSSISQTVAVNSATPNRMGLATATFFIFYDLGSGFGPSILGLIISSTSYSTLYSILGVLVLIILVIYYISTNKKLNNVAI